ncbi:MAG: N-acetylmuramoyl-L-alanine amidase [Cyanomargarita calcarea GSE-NOS-MK-12-04C]|jgi:N-acetylmuramoyl-L-alanine amidase|uniref:N-acetylmuramoyl-L-alanine amidase n=1 Tax=Cyanomargarita calcarea GSE-NOS-MK-12-04C TaxID=2839659 RepID=A0A951QT42_9CYAN|nr:N-acetylmuramoyl-L-alanine amidase [Cyanomargarita calcarea GSE-NOS-MK-12-04C]
MKFGIDIGHNCPHDTGASGIQQEDKLTKEVGEIVIKNLQKAGHTVINCTPKFANALSDSLRQRTEKANTEKVDFYASIHFNASNGIANGTEVYALTKKGSEVANRVLEQLVALGFRNRGVKILNFFVLTNTNMPAILIECCFCDSPIDMAKYNAVAIANAITKGLTDKSGDSKPQTLVVKQPTFLKPSTEQVQNLPAGSCISLAPGNYPILNSYFEENHYLVEWIDSSKANRREHFIFAGHCQIK